MKNLLLFLLSSVLLFSCANTKPDESTTAFGLSKHNAEHYVQKVPGGAQVAVLDSVAFITPTWGQAIHYSNKSGNGLMKLLGFICLGIFAGIIFLLAINKIEMGKGPALAMFGCMVGFIAFTYGRPANIKWNNEKEVQLSVYKSYGSNTQELWDDYYSKNLLVGAPSK